MTPPPTRTTWPLTPIDRFASRWLIQGTWVFDTTLDAEALNRGLARLLDVYPILCGRLSGRRIEWADAGIPFTEDIETALAVEDFGPTCVDVRRFADRFSPARIRHGLAPLLTVKLTHLRNGCVLSMCCSHSCVDGNGFYTLASNLSHATAGRPFRRPVFDRAPMHAVRPRGEVARAARDEGWHRVSLLDMVHAALAWPGRLDRVFVAHYPPELLRRYRDDLAQATACDRLSTNSAIVAHIASRIAAVLDLDAASRVAVSVLVDQRERVAALPNAFAGNAVSAISTRDIPARASAADIAAIVHDRLEPLLARPSVPLESIAELTREVTAHGLAYSSIPLGRIFGRRPTLLYTNSFQNFPIYDLDFGDHRHPIRPVRAIPHNLGDPIVLWPAPPAVGGIDVYFTGALARAVARVAADDPWWAAMRSPQGV